MDVRSKPWLWIDRSLLLSAAVLLALMPVANHYLFRTYALDLGFYTHALFEYRQGRVADNHMIMAEWENHLAGHFDGLLPLLSPLSWLFGSWTLLLIQWAAIVWAGVGIRRLIAPQQAVLARLAQLAFYTFYGVHNALAFDYHSNVLAAALLPWLFLAVQRQQLKKASVLAVLILLAKENMSLWMVFICLALAWEYRHHRAIRRWGIRGAGISAGYFLLIVGLVMPLLSHTDEYRGFLYSQLGEGPLQALVYILQHPLDAFQLWFYADLRDALPDPYKMELWEFVLYSGGALLLFRPAWLLMLFPIFAQKLWHDNPYMWGIGGQYSIEFAPVLIIGVFEALARWPLRTLSLPIGLVQLAAVVMINARNYEETVVFNEKSRLRIFSEEHYTQTAVDVEAVHALLEQIPPDAAVSAHAALVPHLALREHIYQFPRIGEATHLLLCPSMGTYPLSWECYEEVSQQQWALGGWKWEGDFGGVHYYTR